MKFMKKFAPITKTSALTYGLFGFLFWHFAKEMLQVKNNGWFVGQVNLYGDLVFHLSLINKYLVANKIMIDNPIYAQDKVNYPIFADLVTAIVAKYTSVDFALFITTFIVGLITIYVAKSFINHFVKNEKVVFLTLLFFFVNGGFGFYYLLKDYSLSQKSIFDFLFSLPREYTDLKDLGYWWINSYLAYFLPQRAFLFAFPITILVLLILYTGYKKQKTIYFVLAGLLTGSLSLVQAHSLFVLFILTALYAPLSVVFSRDKIATIKNWLIFGILTVIVALPILNAISSVASPVKFIRFAPGWTSKENLLWFWFKNLGLFLPILVAALVWLYKKKEIFILYLPFLVLFIVSNIWVFQPWEFDNSKLLIYWYFASCIIVAYFFYDYIFKKNVVIKILGGILIFFMILSGTVDIFRTFTPVTSYQIFSKTDLEAAESIKLLTAKDAIFVNAQNHNNPIPTLTGRSTYVGYPGWLWSHGVNYSQRENEIKEIYIGSQEADNIIKKNTISYITFGPQEKTDFKINENYLSKFPTINIGNGWLLYDARNLWTDSNR